MTTSQHNPLGDLQAQAVSISGALLFKAVQCRVPIMTTLTSANAAAKSIAALKKHGVTVCSLQEYHKK